MFKNLFAPKGETQHIAWKHLKSVEGLEQIKELSKGKKVLIFKHSTRCGVSLSALHKLETTWKNDEAQNVIPYFLDLIAHRDVSNQIANTFGVMHQSPQLLIIQEGECIFTTSHWQISFEAIKSVIA